MPRTEKYAGFAIDVEILIAVPAVKVLTEKVMVERSEEILQKLRTAAARLVAADWHNPINVKSLTDVPPPCTPSAES